MSKQLIKPVIISARDATNVFRNPVGPWEWPETIRVMISDSFQVLGMNGVGATAENGDPLPFAFALNMVETLYKQGYAIAKLRGDAPKKLKKRAKAK